MKNDVYEFVLATFKPLFGSPQELVSGNGARFTSSKKGKVTVYHADIASGNKAEIAFESSSLATRIGSSVKDVNEFLAELKALTGRGVKINQQFEWPRIGLASMDHVTLVADRLAVRLGTTEPIRGRPSGVERPEQIEQRTSAFDRDASVRAWILEQAKGICEGCGKPAPFPLDDGSPFLEVHHVRWLANGGTDQVTNAVALCPNCHRRSHLSIDRSEFATVLYKKVGRLIEQ